MFYKDKKKNPRDTEFVVWNRSTYVLNKIKAYEGWSMVMYAPKEKTFMFFSS